MYTYSTKTNPSVNLQGPGYTELDGKLYVFGGSTDGSNPTTTALVYDPVEDTWDTLTSLPSARWHPSVQAVNGKIYIIGGRFDAGVGDVSDVNWEYDPVEDTYTTKQALPTARSHAFNGVVNGKIYIIGGQSGSSHLTTNEEYNPSTNSWTTKASLSSGRSGVDKSAIVDGKIFCIGGYDGTNDLDDVDSYDPSTNSWSSHEPMPSVRDSMAIGVLSGKIIVAGGYKHASNARQKYVEEYDPTLDTWTALDDLTHDKENPAVGVFGNSMYISHGGGTNLHETITFIPETIADFEAEITGGSISSTDGVITITLNTTGETETPPEDPPEDNGLLEGLVSFYSLQTDAVDEHGSNDLTNNGSISFSSGAQFDTGKYFSISDGSQSGLDLSDELTFHIKHSFSSLPTGENGAQDIISKWVSTGNQRGFIWSYRNLSSTPGFTFFVCSNGTTNESLRKNYTLSASTPYHLTITWKGSTSTAEFFVDGDSIGTATGSITSLFNNTADFLVGQQGGGNYLKGTGGYLGIWNKVLTNTQIGILAGGATYNSFD